MSETRLCQSCKADFVIEDEDFGFYDKIKVPPPTWCPKCRNIRRWSYREENNLHKNTCALCGKSILATVREEKPFTVYCRECWRSDKWDPMEYGRDYDFSRPFFLQYRELFESVPRVALTGRGSINSEYIHASDYCKNCYNIFWSFYSENSQNSFALLSSKYAYDCYTADNSDHVYEVLHSNRMYKSSFAYFSDECMDSSFVYNCVGCSDCFGCVNLRKQKYRIFNEQLSKEDYEKKIKYWDLGSYARLQEATQKFKEIYLATPRRFAHVLNCKDVVGDILRDTKNCKNCFTSLDGVENCKYLYFGGLNLKDSYDVSGGGLNAELQYETMACTHASRAFFSCGADDSKDISYTDWASNSSNLFGCMALKNKRYCILNKQYTKEEYERMVPKIIEHMNSMPYIDKNGRVYKYGEFFPPEFSAFAYNESFAYFWYPKTKEEILKEGLVWRDQTTRDYKITLSPESLPDHIKDVEESILGEIIGCKNRDKLYRKCSTAFRITSEELAFYKGMNISLPRTCVNCRYTERLNWRNRFQTWPRICSCAGAASDNGAYENNIAHGHSAAHCSEEFETTYAPDRPEIIYCDKCYKSEFL